MFHQSLEFWKSSQLWPFVVSGRHQTVWDSCTGIVFWVVTWWIGFLCVCVCVCVCVWCALSSQSCATLCSPVDCSPLVSSVRGISQTRILEWGAISYSRGSSWLMGWTHTSCISCIGKNSLPLVPPEKSK